MLSLKGQFLVAMPEMGDERFHDAVIFMVGHGDEGAMGDPLFFRDPGHERYVTLPPRHFAVTAGACISNFISQDQLRLPRPDQIDIDLGQEFGVEQRTVLGAARIVDRVARAEIIEPI